MSQIMLEPERVGRRGEALYQRDLRAAVETEDNIGKMIIIDVETGDYEIDDRNGLDAARNLQAKHLNASLYGIRIGYNVAAVMGGVLERTTSSFTANQEAVLLQPAMWQG